MNSVVLLKYKATRKVCNESVSVSPDALQINCLLYNIIINLDLKSQSKAKVHVILPLIVSCSVFLKGLGLH